MSTKVAQLLLAVLLLLQGTALAAAQEPEPTEPAYVDAIQRTMAMVSEPQARQLAVQHGLEILNVTWEDTGRYENSSVGPNISDVTIQVQYTDPATRQPSLALMPVIRYPNFTDQTADLRPEHFFLLVGNERGGPLRRVSLVEYLGNFRHYLSDADSWAGNRMSLLAERDTHVLVSAQAAFLPIPRAGSATFNPVIFNYQSYAGDPAVLTIVATREGTSATIIDNTRDAFPSGWSWGQRLFFNQHGQRASFHGQRLSDFAAQEQPEAQNGATVAAGGEQGLNMVLLIQVPLKQKRPLENEPLLGEAAGGGVPMPSAAQSDVEAAVIGHGDVEGPFTELDGLPIERDERFPIRVTVQFYKATSNGVVSAADLADIDAQIKRVYADGDYVGSLVVDGPSNRPTEHAGPRTQPVYWWDAFWRRFERNTGLNRQAALQLWQALNMVARPGEHIPR